MLRTFNWVGRSQQKAKLTPNEAYEIMPKGRVVNIDDAVKFLGRDPQTVDSAIDLGISAEELEASASEYALMPLIGTPQQLLLHHPELFINSPKGVRHSGYISVRSFIHAPIGYRLIRIAPLQETVGKELSDQEKILMHHKPLAEQVAGAHCAALATVMLHALLGIDITQGRLMRTRQKLGSYSVIGMRLISGKLSLEFAHKSAQPSVAAFSEVVL